MVGKVYPGLWEFNSLIDVINKIVKFIIHTYGMMFR